MLQPGDTLNHGAYRIERELGTGGLGVVYPATKVALHRLVAILTLKTERAAQEPGVTEAFAAEACLTAWPTWAHTVFAFGAAHGVGAAGTSPHGPFVLNGLAGQGRLVR